MRPIPKARPGKIKFAVKPKSFSCSYCNQVFPSLDIMFGHEEEHEKKLDQVANDREANEASDDSI